MIELSPVPLFQEPAIIRWHAYAAIAAFALGIVQFLAPKGTFSHRTIGYLWAGLMMWIAASSFWIHTVQQFGRWSWIHILSIIVLIYVPLGVWRAHTHKVKAHSTTMVSLFVFALLVAGGFAFLPGRVMHEVVFGG